MSKAIQLAILASGNGTNAQQISEYFADKSEVNVNVIIYNKRDAYVATRAEKLGIEARYFNRHSFYETDEVLTFLKSREIDYVILAGFLLLVPENLLAAFPNRIINIHPALLPKYGGKGMYGHNVHEAVVAAHEKESGATVHLVSEEIDKGRILAQAKVPVLEGDTPEVLAARVLEQEHNLYWKTIRDYYNEMGH